MAATPSVLTFEGIRTTEQGYEVVNTWHFIQRAVESIEVVFSPAGDKQVVILRSMRREYVFWMSYPTNQADKIKKAIEDFANDRFTAGKKKNQPKPFKATYWKVDGSGPQPFFLIDPPKETTTSTCISNRENSPATPGQWGTNEGWIRQLVDQDLTHLREERSEGRT